MEGETLCHTRPDDHQANPISSPSNQRQLSFLPSLRCLLDETLLGLDTLCPLTVTIVSHRTFVESQGSEKNLRPAAIVYPP